MTGNLRPDTAAVVKARQSKEERRIFVLDTNVLMHDPTAIFRFEEHDVYIPMTVLEELDAGKKGLSESARNVRQVSRFLDELMRDASKKQIDRGLALPTSAPINHGKRPPGGRLFFQTQLLESVLPASLPGHGADNAILADTLALQQKFPTARVTLVSKDINLRIKAAIVGVQAEDYSSDKTIEDADLLISGVQRLPPNFWEKHGKGMESWQQQSRTFYRVRGPLVREWQTNQFVYDPGENGVEAIVRKLEGESAILELTIDYRTERNNVWGVTFAQSRTESCLEFVDGSGNRFRYRVGSRRHRQNPVDACGRPRADLGSQPFQRNHNDAGHDSIGRRHRLSSRHRRGKDGALDGSLDGQPRSADAESTGRHLGTGRHQRSAPASDKDPVA